MQPDHGAGLGDREGHEVWRDLAAERGGLELAVDDRDRHHRLDVAQPAHRLGAGHQPGAQRTGEGGQDDVVDGAAVLVADGAVVGERGLDSDYPALLGELAGECVAAVGTAAGQPGEHLARARREPVRGPDCRADGLPDRVARRVAVGEVVVQRAGQQSGVRGVPVRVPLVAAEDLHPGVLVEQHLAEVDGLDAVDERLVGLVEQGDPAVGKPLDEVDLPQRPAPIEGTRDDPRDQVTQLLGVAGAGQRGAAHVVADVEVLVVDPDRGGEMPRDRLHALAVARHERDPVEDQRHEPVVVETGVAGVEDLHRRVVAWRARRLELEERKVAWA